MIVVGFDPEAKDGERSAAVVMEFDGENYVVLDYVVLEPGERLTHWNGIALAA